MAQRIKARVKQQNTIVAQTWRSIGCGHSGTNRWRHDEI
jgi:hypothetical protein